MLLFSRQVMSDFLRPHWLQHSRLPFPSTISQSVLKLISIESVMPSNHLILFHAPSPPALKLSQHQGLIKSRLFALGGQSIRASASASVLPVRIQGWFPLGLTSWFPCCPRDSQGSSPEPQFESMNSSVLSLLHDPTLTTVHDYWKNHSFDYQTIVGKVMSLLFNMLSRVVIAFLPRSKHLLISWP